LELFFLSHLIQFGFRLSFEREFLTLTRETTDKMTRQKTRTSVEWGTDPAVSDLGDSNPTSSRAGTSTPFDDDINDEDFFNAEEGWYVAVSINLIENLQRM
jgi:hypothetical protein